MQVKFCHLGGLRWHPTPILLPGKSHGQRSLVGCRPWGHEESDRTKRLHFHFSLSCIGEGHGNPLQCSCLENPRDRGAWWAAIYGVAQSRTRLKRLSSSSSSGIWKGACGGCGPAWLLCPWHKWRLALPMAQISVQSPALRGPEACRGDTCDSRGLGGGCGSVLLSWPVQIEKWLPLPSLRRG